jgi:hypothetical protein
VTTVLTTRQRIRALLLLAVCIVYVEAAEIFSSHVALTLSGANWFAVVSQGLRIAILLAGFFLMARLLPDRSILEPERPTLSLGWGRNPETNLQIGTGAAIGWGMVVAVVLPMAAVGGLQIFFDFSASSWLLFFITLLATGLGAAVRQTVFAGYPFQRLVDAAGPSFATILMACFVGVTQYQDAQGSRIAMLTAILLQVLFCIATLRTGSLWLGWALDVSARLSLGAVFGLPVAGSGKYATLVLSNSHAPDWLTGGVYGPAGSLLAPLAVLAGIYFLMVATRVDVIASIRPGGIPLDIEAHHAPTFPAMEQVAAKPAGTSLVQILPNTPAPSAPAKETGSDDIPVA